MSIQNIEVIDVEVSTEVLHPPVEEVDVSDAPIATITVITA